MLPVAPRISALALIILSPMRSTSCHVEVGRRRVARDGMRPHRMSFKTGWKFSNLMTRAIAVTARSGDRNGDHNSSRRDR